MSPASTLRRAVAERMIGIPDGQIVLRDESAKTHWTVEIGAFQLASQPVTRELYRAVRGDAPTSSTGPRAPVTDVSWRQAVAFCNVLSQATGHAPCYVIGDDPDCLDVVCDRDADGYRLPTEAEWEYACRAGDPGVRYGDLDEIAWYRGNSDGMVHDVATRQPNAWGLHDISATCGSGAGTSTIPASTARTACSAAAVGLIGPEDVGRHAAARATRPSASTTSGSGSPGRCEWWRSRHRVRSRRSDRAGG